MDIFDDHIDKVNNARSKKYLPDDTKILVCMGGQGLIDYYNEKHFGIKRNRPEPKPKVNKKELKKAFQKQKDFVSGKYW